MSNLTIRVLVALVGIPIILLLTMAGGFYFFVFVVLVSSLALHEYYRLAIKRGALPQVGLGLFFGICVNAAFVHHRLQVMFPEFLLPSMAECVLILFLLFVPAILVNELFRNKGTPTLNVATTLSGVLYVSLFMGSLVGLRELFIPQVFPVDLHFGVSGIPVPPEIIQTIDDWGGYTIITIFAAIWLCDSAAYFAGTRWGKHKLFPRVSPNKSWEGAVAGFIFAIVTFVVARQVVLPYMDFSTAIVCGMIVGIFGQAGDLVESLIKRDTGVKDSSSLIPGHGGVLDRFDSLMFVSPLLFFYFDFVVF
ncbi:MAG: phosphatidate cytidylyltransferase [Bacteroidota bacterium]